MSTGNGNANGDATSVSYWLTYLAKQGPMTVFLGAMSYFLAGYIVIPMRDDQKRYIDAVISTNEKNSKTFESLTTSNAQGFVDLRTMHGEANRKLETIGTTLQQIRDDQRSGAWQHKLPERNP